MNEKFISDIRSSDADIRFAAWRSAGEQDPAEIGELAKLASNEDPGIAKAAREAITTMVHSVGKDISAPKRRQIIDQLLAVPNGQTLRLLSLIAGEESVAPVAKLLTDPALREEAIFCLERIPAKEASQALMTALYSVPADFKPRVLAALGHRKVTEAASACVKFMQSPDKNISMAAARAFGRIGHKPVGLFRFPASAEMDSKLRYADSQGNTPTAIQIYKTALASAEPHIQCAGIIGLSKIETAESAATIFRYLRSDNRIVRITAENAWKKMAKPEPDPSGNKAG